MSKDNLCQEYSLINNVNVKIISLEEFKNKDNGIIEDIQYKCGVVIIINNYHDDKTTKLNFRLNQKNISSVEKDLTYILSNKFNDIIVYDDYTFSKINEKDSYINKANYEKYRLSNRYCVENRMNPVTEIMSFIKTYKFIEHLEFKKRQGAIYQNILINRNDEYVVLSKDAIALISKVELESQYRILISSPN